MVGGGSPEQVERQLEEWARQAEQKAERYQRMGAAVAAVNASEATSDGMVRVTVNASGAVSSLVLSDQIRQSSGAEVSARIMECIQRAQAKLAGQVAAAMQATVGDEPDTVETVVSGYEQRFPEPVTPQSDRPRQHLRVGEIDEEEPPPPSRPATPPRRRPDDDDDWGDDSILR